MSKQPLRVPPPRPIEGMTWVREDDAVFVWHGKWVRDVPTS